MDIYEKNLSVLKKVNPELAEKLSLVTTNEKYEVFQGKTFKDINILDTSTKEFLYQTPKEDNAKILDLLEKKREYPFLYFFGIGNGYVISELLKNKKHERIVVFEPEIEILFIALHLFDFSTSLKSIQLVVMMPEQFTFPLGIHMFGKDKSRFYAKVYNLDIQLPYYDTHYAKDVKELNNLLIKSVHHVVSVYGNDVTDTLTGFKHHINNLAKMLKGYQFSELVKKKNCETAVVVSTGPSLQKQLDKLKSIQNYVSIISVDASLPILEEHGIKPDIVTSIERVPLTAKFFEKTTDSFQKDIIFVSVSLQHEKTLSSIKGKKVIVMRPFDYNKYFGLDDYGYLGSGLSSANMAHELAIQMGYTTCILIGQDLAFAADGRSHSKNHVFGENDVQKTKTPTLETKAYGKDGNVSTSSVWLLFKNYFEQAIEQSKDNMKTIDATEGGAKIEGAIEMPFSKAISNYTDNKLEKKRISLTKIDEKYRSKSIEKTKKILKDLIEKGDELQKELEDAFLIIFEASRQMEKKSKEEMLELWSIHETLHYINTIEKIRETIQSNSTVNKFYYDAIQSDLLHYELDLAKIKVMYVSNQKENQEKAIEWILGHRMWLFSLAGTLKNVINILNDGLKKL